mmetsp:Transcript_58558/g.63243  ORF Transcript_58558/g.63243 Transcript_58558/m.63243 type:complete len:261 (+) Transcript_58558:127-909(+)
MMMYCKIVFVTALSIVTLTTPRHGHGVVMAFVSSPRRATATTATCTIAIPMATTDNDKDDDTPKETPKETSTKYDVSKLVGGQEGDDSSGFNQFDPVLSTTQFLSRRFGIVGGLAVFVGLALVEGREIVKGFGDVTPLEGAGEWLAPTPSGLRIKELTIGKAGSVPLPGYIIGLRAKVNIGERTIYETAAGEKPVAFKLGQRPFQNVICEGVEEGIQGMKVGGKRILDVPSNLAPPGVELPPGVPLTYEIELTEVLSGYF